MKRIENKSEDSDNPKDEEIPSDCSVLGDAEQQQSPQTRKKKTKISKEELDKLMKLRNRTIRSKEKEFLKVSERAHSEWKEFNPCEKCKFLSSKCHKTCGVLMKWECSEGLLKTAASYGNSNRIVSEAEYTDTSSVNLGVADEVDLINARESSGMLFSESNEIGISELDSYSFDEYDDFN